MIKFFKQKNKDYLYCYSKRCKRGFTLVETLIAISIFSMSIVGLMSVLGGGISNISYAKEKIIAGYLAQEGLEYIRNMRDTYVLYSISAQTGWTDFNNNLIDTSACQFAVGCYVGDLNGEAFTNPNQPMASIAVIACGGSCPSFLYDTETGKYNYETGTDSGFIRRINVTHPSANETKIFSTVYWTQGSGDYSITLTENLFNWVE